MMHYGFPIKKHYIEFSVIHPKYPFILICREDWGIYYRCKKVTLLWLLFQLEVICLFQVKNMSGFRFVFLVEGSLGSTFGVFPYQLRYRILTGLSS